MEKYKSEWTYTAYIAYFMVMPWRSHNLGYLSPFKCSKNVPDTSRYPRVAVVILCWKGKKFLQDFLPGVLKTDYPNYQVYVIDNASQDGSADYIRQHFPNVPLIELSANRGFAGGYNAGLRGIEADYYVLLNQDVEVKPGWLTPLVAHMEANPEVGAVQPKLRSYHQKDHFEYAGAAGGYIDRLGYPFCRGRLFDAVEQDGGQYDSVADICWASGACMLVRAALYHRLGGLDDDFFAHMEEVDLCWRIRHAGYKIRCVPEAVVWHVGGGSLPKSNPQKTYLNFRNNLFLLVKNVPFGPLVWLLPLRLLMDLLATVYALLQGHIADSLAIFRAWAGGVWYWGKMWRKRPDQFAGQPSRYAGSIVWAYFIRGKRTFREVTGAPQKA